MAMTLPSVSALYWLPLVEGVGLPGPRTEFVMYDHHAGVGAIEGEADCVDAITATHEAMWEATQRIGLPAFIRTDLSSAKHDGPAFYKATDKETLGHAMFGTISDNEIKFWLFGPTPQAFMVREWLDLEASFSAFGGHAIAMEQRMFATADGLVCSHFYWPHEAIEGNADEDGWKSALADMAVTPYPSELEVWAVQAAAACSQEEAWSVDFAQDTTGKWWLIDMAPAQDSWHPEHG